MVVSVGRLRVGLYVGIRTHIITVCKAVVGLSCRSRRPRDGYHDMSIVTTTLKPNVGLHPSQTRKGWLFGYI